MKLIKIENGVYINPTNIEKIEIISDRGASNARATFTSGETVKLLSDNMGSIEEVREFIEDLYTAVYTDCDSEDIIYEITESMKAGFMALYDSKIEVLK